jgi:hypothetical protein
MDACKSVITLFSTVRSSAVAAISLSGWMSG